MYNYCIITNVISKYGVNNCLTSQPKYCQKYPPNYFNSILQITAKLNYILQIANSLIVSVAISMGKVLLMLRYKGSHVFLKPSIHLAS